MKRCFDIFFSLLGLIISLPFFIIIAIFIKIDSKGPIFYCQNRVGIKGKDFKIIKFRTMRINSDKFSLLSFGDKDDRVTKVGRFLRKYRLDELPQFINIIKNDMSFVGPRPEVRKYVDYYNEEQMKILDYKPGVTDFACIKFIDLEADMLKNNIDNYEQIYIYDIMKSKLDLNLQYFNTANLLTDFNLLIKTVCRTFNYKRM